MLTFEDFVIANFFAQFLAACYLICGTIDGEYSTALWVHWWLFYVMVGALNVVGLLFIKDEKEREEDRLMMSDSYILERLKWLKDATKMLYYHPPPVPDARMSQVEKVARRCTAVEDLLRRYCAWEEKNTYKTTIRDLDSKKELMRKIEFCYSLRSALGYRKAALLNAACAASKLPKTADREKATWEVSMEYIWVASSIQNLWDEGWEDFMGLAEYREMNGTIEQEQLYKELQRKYFKCC
jgi:hypothetical protein